ncbi:hypothetical protein B0H14DRAFT_2753270 [Mycena olivaceomarginata]|nr:hypothetical protein B0H14DRAFT_2753270 [Mycena olivaceomarginata]
MTVAQYEEDEKWRQDFELYPRLKHPNASALAVLLALRSHLELIPLETYRQFHRPSSDLVWTCIEGVLVRRTPIQECSQYRCWYKQDDRKGLEATICVKRESLQLCLAAPLPCHQTQPDSMEALLSSWHSWHFKHQRDCVQPSFPGFRRQPRMPKSRPEIASYCLHSKQMPG